MKRELLIFIFFFVFKTCISQNWNLVNQNYIANYRTSIDEVITKSLWVDSIKTVEEDTSFHFLNRVATTTFCSNCNCQNFLLEDQGQFLGKEIIYTHDKILFGNEAKLVLYPYYTVGESWMYDSLNNITAMITSTEIDTIFGQLDSIKTILLSNDKELRLAKHFGIIEFPQIDNSSDLLLKGIDNEGLGEILPKFRDFYDFNVGDVFEYVSSNGHVESGGSSTRIKKEVLSKEYMGDTIKYDFKIVSKTYPEGIIETEYFIDSVNHITNSYPGERIRIIDRPIYNFFSFSFFDATQSSFIDENDILGIGYNYHEFPFYHALPSDTIEDCFITITHTFKVGLGETEFSAIYFESGESWRLVGSVKGQDTIGTITPDIIFVSTEEKESTINLNIFPNPSRDILNVNFENNNHSIIQLELINITGKIIYEKELNSSSNQINITRFPRGIYYIKILLDDHFLTHKILIH